MQLTRHGTRLRGLRLGAAVMSLASLLATAASAQEPCARLTVSFNGHLSRADLAAIVSAARQLLNESTCDAATRREVGRKAALAHIREAGRIADGPNAAAAKLKLLEGGTPFGQPWQLMAMIGDLRQVVPDARGRPNRSGASTAYQAALADISNTVNVPTSPPREQVERLIRLAQQTRMLSNEFVRGDVLMTRGVRDVAIEAVPVPVQFVRDSDEMTPLGRQYADETLKLLTEQGRPKIALIGHTDPDGGDQYNVDLSKRRALAFKRFLVEQGYVSGNIDTDGRGKRQPLRIENEGSYSKEDLYQMLRRVEVKFQ